MSQRSTELARQFEDAVDEFVNVVRGCTDEEWGAICDAEGWTVAQTAQHVSGQFPLEMAFITAAAEARPMPTVTWDELNAMNDGRAGKSTSVSRGEVLEEMQTGAPSVAAYIRALSDEQLERTGPLSLADGAVVTTQQLIEGPVLIAHMTGHLASIRGATVRSLSSV